MPTSTEAELDEIFRRYRAGIDEIGRQHRDDLKEILADFWAAFDRIRSDSARAPLSPASQLPVGGN